MAKARVYFTREITPQAMARLYDALGIRLSGKTAVKISTGEPGGHNFLQPALIGPLTERRLRRPEEHHTGALEGHSGARFFGYRTL